MFGTSAPGTLFAEYGMTAGTMAAGTITVMEKWTPILHSALAHVAQVLNGM